MDPKQSLAEIQTYLDDLLAERDGLQTRWDNLIATLAPVAVQLRLAMEALSSVQVPSDDLRHLHFELITDPTPAAAETPAPVDLVATSEPTPDKLFYAVIPMPVAPAPASELAPEPQPIETSRFTRRYTAEDAAAWADYMAQGHSFYQAGLKFDVDLKTVKAWVNRIHRTCEECGAVMSAEEAAECTAATGYWCRACRPVSETPGRLITVVCEPTDNNDGAI